MNSSSADRITSPARHIKGIEEVGNPLDGAGDQFNVFSVHPISLKIIYHEYFASHRDLKEMFYIMLINVLLPFWFGETIF